MYYHLLIAVLIKMGINSLQVVMIEPVKFGIHNQGICFIPFKVIKMQYIQWHLMFHMGKFYLT